MYNITKTKKTIYIHIYLYIPVKSKQSVRNEYILIHLHVHLSAVHHLPIKIHFSLSFASKKKEYEKNITTTITTKCDQRKKITNSHDSGEH